MSNFLLHEGPFFYFDNSFQSKQLTSFCLINNSNLFGLKNIYGFENEVSKSLTLCNLIEWMLPLRLQCLRMFLYCSWLNYLSQYVNKFDSIETFHYSDKFNFGIQLCIQTLMCYLFPKIPSTFEVYDWWKAQRSKVSFRNNL